MDDFNAGTAVDEMHGTVRDENERATREKVKKAQKAIKGAAITAFICTAITTVFAVLSGIGVQVFRGIGVWSLFDAAVFLGLGIGTWQGSRICSVALLVVYAFEQMYNMANGYHGGLVIVFALAFINGIRGAFALNRLRNPGNNDLW